MLSKYGFLSGLIGLSMMGLPLRAIGANHSNHPPIPELAASSQNSLVTLARDDDDENHHHHGWHHDRDHDEEYREHHNRGDWQPEGRDAGDYNWGGRRRYDYPPSYFAAPAPQGWDAPRRHSYWQNKRQTAVRLRNQALAHGDNGAAERLNGVIHDLNQRIR
jgi:hypothetical protein